MNLMNPASSLLLFAGESHACPYLDDKTAITAFVDPDFPVSNELYGLLLERGFRRSGNHVYRPHCPQCNACISVRVPVDRFAPNRNQQRILKKHACTRVVSCDAEFKQNHFNLYKRYLAVRHEDSDMNIDSPEQYMGFLDSKWCNTRFYEFYDVDGYCFAVSVVDHVARGLSAVYTFFDPDFSSLSPGQYAILWLIQHARYKQLDWLYLGYWIETCKKMSYKTGYRPIQAYVGQEWKILKR